MNPFNLNNQNDGAGTPPSHEKNARSLVVCVALAAVVFVVPPIWSHTVDWVTNHLAAIYAFVWVRDVAPYVWAVLLGGIVFTPVRIAVAMLLTEGLVFLADKLDLFGAVTGGGKWATTLSKISLMVPQRALWPDMKGQITAVSSLAQTLLGKHLWTWAPHPLPGVDVSHSCNFLDILTPDSPRLVSDIQMITENFTPSAGGMASSAECFARRRNTPVSGTSHCGSLSPWRRFTKPENRAHRKLSI